VLNRAKDYPFKADTAVVVVIALGQIGLGVAGGVLVGLCGYFFKYMTNVNHRIRAKQVWILFWIFTFNATGLASNWPNIIYIGCIAFGYVSKRIWAVEEHPVPILDFIISHIMVLLFTSIGALLLL
jgi:hypothetical protein